MKNTQEKSLISQKNIGIFAHFVHFGDMVSIEKNKKDSHQRPP